MRKGVLGRARAGTPRRVAPERQDEPRPDGGDELEELDEMIDEFGDRSGPDPAREPDLELGDDAVIVEPASDED
jgi:hypothetical protein